MQRWLIAFSIWNLVGCKLEQPGVGTDYVAPRFIHASTQSACSECHEKDRPATATHPKTGECSTCHNSSDSNAGWLPVISFEHATGLTACNTCHEKDRPDEPHVQSTDCVGCHNPSDDQDGWLPPTSFSHNPAPTSCTRCHADDRPAPPHVKEGDCVSCHKFPNWK